MSEACVLMSRGVLGLVTPRLDHIGVRSDWVLNFPMAGPQYSDTLHHHDRATNVLCARASQRSPAPPCAPTAKVAASISMTIIFVAILTCSFFILTGVSLIF